MLVSRTREYSLLDSLVGLRLAIRCGLSWGGLRGSFLDLILPCGGCRECRLLLVDSCATRCDVRGASGPEEGTRCARFVSLAILLDAVSRAKRGKLSNLAGEWSVEWGEAGAGELVLPGSRCCITLLRN